MDVLSLFIDLALDPHESSCFDQRSQKLTQLVGSHVGSDSSRCLDRPPSTLDTVVSVGIRFGVTECFSPYDSTRASVLSVASRFPVYFFSFPPFSSI